jgi:hypothetical protein
LLWFPQTSLPPIVLQQHAPSTKSFPSRGSTPTLPAKCVLESSLGEVITAEDWLYL